MNTTTKSLRRTLSAAFAATAIGGAAVALTGLPAPSATAATDPCAASEVAKTIGAVATDTGEYLEANPKTNQALTSISKQQMGPQSLGALKSYFDANPEVGEDMQELQQPLVALSSQCELPITVPQLLGLMKAAQAQGGLPGAQPGAQNVSVPGAAAPAQQSPASPATQGAGPLPGPATATG